MPGYLEDRPSCVCDTECFPNYWSIGFKSIADGRTRVFEHYEGNPLDRKAVLTVLRKWRILTFNGINYDIPMILYALRGASPEELKKANDELIKFGVPWWTFLKRLDITIPDFIDHVDLQQVSPGAPTMPSLKLLGGRLHSRKLQEMPVEIDDHIDDFKRQIIRAYHGNDLDTTIDLATDLRAQLELRTAMSRQYGVDLRSKSDAQIAEVVIRTEIERSLGRKVYAPDVEAGHFQYQVPGYVCFETAEMRHALEQIREARLYVTHAGLVEAPENVKSLEVRIGGKPYKMGLGGLHSKESRISHYSDDTVTLKDRDVTSYYPKSILLQQMAPKHLGPVFLRIYESIFNRRIAAKKAGDKNTAETLKITLNGCYGKLGSPYSIFFSPNLMIQVTLTGQLAILMLIERLELAGIKVISANTDGIVSRVPKHLDAIFESVILDWELTTGYDTEETAYTALHSRDVNNYIAFSREKDGKIKTKLKGAFGACGPGLLGAAGQKKNPDCEISIEAVINYLRDGTPIEETIEWCDDPRKFLCLRRVTGGAEKDGMYLGKVLRWYYSKTETGGFVYVKNGNAVPQSIGAKLMMELTQHVPADVDHDYYVREAYAILQDLGVGVIDPKLKGRTGRTFARLPDAKGVHIVDLESGIAICGKARDSIRDSWVEYERMPDDHRLCAKCKKADAL